MMRFSRRQAAANAMLVLAFAFSAWCLWLDITNKDEPDWFNRSGALIVLTSVIVESVILSQQLAYLINYSANVLHFSLGMTKNHADKIHTLIDKTISEFERQEMLQHIEDNAEKTIEKSVTSLGDGEIASNKATFLSYIALFGASIGTLVWAYGDWFVIYLRDIYL